MRRSAWRVRASHACTITIGSTPCAPQSKHLEFSGGVQRGAAEEQFELLLATKQDDAMHAIGGFPLDDAMHAIGGFPRVGSYHHQKLNRRHFLVCHNEKRSRLHFFE